MKEYPLIKIKGGRIRIGDIVYKGKEAFKKIEEMSKDYGMVYVIDIDGCKKNSPNLDFYKKVKGNIWVDSCPRNIGDLMDLVIVGIERITIWDMNEKNIKELKEIFEGDIFVGSKDTKKAVDIVKKYDFNGVVIEENQDCKENIEIWKIYEKEGFIRRIREWKI